METPSVDKLQQSRAWTDYAMRNFPKWRQFQTAAVMYAAKHKVFVVWDYTEAGPKLVTALVVEGVEISLSTGMRVMLHDLAADEYVVLDHTPAQLVPNVYFWVPQFMDMRYTPKLYSDPQTAWELNFPICVKTQSHPVKSLTPGHRYISTKADFESRWPDFK